MNIVISGPFGLGSLSDEAVLAGLLARLAVVHTITVLTSDPERVAAAHPLFAASVLTQPDANDEDDDDDAYDDDNDGDDDADNLDETRELPPTNRIGKVNANDNASPASEHRLIELPAPGSMLSTAKAWNALAKGHALVLASAGTISDAGNPPARVWLSHLEHGRTAGVKTALVGIGARPIPDAREKARVQRFLHNFTDCISARDEASKVTVCGYGMSSSRISNNAATTLALAIKPVTAAVQPGRIGIVLTARVPSRDEYGFEAAHLSGHVAAPMANLIGALLDDSSLNVTIFHDDTEELEESLQALIPAIAVERVTTLSPSQPIEKIRESMAGCEVIFSCSLHGLILAATAGAPVIGLQAETGAPEFMRSLLTDSDTWLLPPGQNGEVFDARAAQERIAAARNGSAALRETIAARLKLLLRKEAQNARMLELLVPRRDRRTDRGPVGDDRGGGYDERRAGRPKHAERRTGARRHR